MFQGAVGILFVDKFLYVRLFVCHRTFVLSYLRCAWVSEALGISVWATQRWQTVVLCCERFNYEVVPLVRPLATCVFVVSRAHVFVVGVVFFFVGSVATIGGRHGRFVGLLQFVFLRNRDSNAKFGRSWAMPDPSDMEHFTTDSFPDDAFVSILN